MPGCLNQGLTEIQDTNGWDGRPLPAGMAQRAVAGPGGERNLHVTTVRPGHHDTPARRRGRTARLRDSR